MHAFKCALADLQIFLEVGMHAFPKSLVNSTKKKRYRVSNSLVLFQRV